MAEKDWADALDEQYGYKADDTLGFEPTSMETPDVEEDWADALDRKYGSGGSYTEMPEPTDVGGDTETSLPKRVWERMRYSEGRLLEGLGTLVQDAATYFDQGDSTAGLTEEMKLWGQSLQSHAKGEIPPEEWAAIDAEVSKEFIEPIDPSKPEWDYKKPLDFSNIKRGEAGLETVGWSLVDSAVDTAVMYLTGRAAGGAAMAGLRKLPSWKRLEEIAKVGKLAEAGKGGAVAAEAIAAGKRAQKIIQRVEAGTFAAAAGTAEGIASAGPAGVEWDNKIDQIVAQDGFSRLLLDSPYAQNVYTAATEDGGMNQEEAAAYTIQMVKDAGRTEKEFRTFLTTTALSAPAGFVLAPVFVRTPFSKAFASGKGKGLVKGAATEFGQESFQSTFETFWDNVATQKYADENVERSQGLLQSWLKGGATGAAMGGAFGLSAPTKAQAAKAEDAKKTQGDLLKLNVHAQQALAGLMETHGLTEEEAMKLVDPILRRFAESQNIVEAAADLRHLETTGRTRERGLDNVQPELLPDFGPELDVNIEFEAGETRGDTVLKYAYGSFNGTVDADGMNTDVIASGTGPRIFIVEKMGKDGKFEQHKVLYGFATEEEALDAFYSMYQKVGEGRYEKAKEFDPLGSVTEVTQDELSQFLAANTAWNKEQGLQASDEPLTPDEDITLRKDSDLQAGIEDIETQLSYLENEDGSYPLEAEPLMNRLKTLKNEQRSREQGGKPTEAEVEANTKPPSDEEGKGPPPAAGAAPTPVKVPETTETKEVPRGEAVQQVSTGERPGASAAEVLPEVPRGVDEGEQAETQPAAAGTEAEGEREGLRERVQGAGETGTATMPDVRGEEGGDASPELQQATTGSVAVPGAPSGTAPAVSTKPTKLQQAAAKVTAAFQEEEAKAQEATRGHDAEQGGLRGHSMGGNYPFMVVAQGKPGSLKWRVQTPDGAFTKTKYDSQEKAEAAAKRAKARLSASEKQGKRQPFSLAPDAIQPTTNGAEGAIDVNFLHLSRTPALQTLSGRMAGTSGVARQRSNVGYGPTANRIYIYAQDLHPMYRTRTTTGAEPSTVGLVSKEVYSGTARNLYDVDKDSLGIKGDSPSLTEDMEQAMLDAGFDGWYWQGYPGINGGMGVILNKDVAAMYHGNREKVKALLSEPSMSQRLVTWETIPGKQSPFYEAAGLLTREELSRFHAGQLLGVIIQSDFREDMLAREMGVPSRLLIERVGGYEGKVMPSMQVSLQSDEQATLYAQAIKMIYGQDAAPWMHAHEGGKEHGLLIQPTNPVTPQQLQAFENGLQSRLSTGFSMMPDGRIAVANFAFMNVSDAAFDAAVEASAQNAFPYDTIITFRQDSQYNGEDQQQTAQIVQVSASKLGRPNLLQWIHAAKARAAKNAGAFFHSLPANHPARVAYERRPEAKQLRQVFSLAEGAVQKALPGIGEDQELDPQYADPFYSALLRTVEEGPKSGMPKKGGAAIKTWLESRQKKGDFKLEEAEWLGLYEFLDGEADAFWATFNTEAYAKYLLWLSEQTGVDTTTLQEDSANGVVKATVAYKVPDAGKRLKELRQRAGSVDAPEVITRDHVIQFVRQNQVKLTETMLGSNTDVDDEASLLEEQFYGLARALSNKYGLLTTAAETWAEGEWQTVPPENRDYWAQHAARFDKEATAAERADVAAAYEAWQSGTSRLTGEQLEGKTQYENWTLGGETVQRQRELLLRVKGIGGFNAAHFVQYKDVVVHVRFNTRLADDGQRILFIEEIQSDRHQKGREFGYREKTPPRGRARKASELAPMEFYAEVLREFEGLEAEFGLLNLMPEGEELNKAYDVWDERQRSLTLRMNNWYRNIDGEGRFRIEPIWQSPDDGERYMMWEAIHPSGLGGNYFATLQAAVEYLEGVQDPGYRSINEGVPRAPFMKTQTWAMVAMKRMIRYAAEKGYAQIGWTTGDQQNARYDLFRQFEHIQYNPQTEYLEATTYVGNEVGEYVEKDALAEYIGEDAAAYLQGEIDNFEADLDYFRDRFEMVEMEDGEFDLYEDGELIYSGMSEDAAREYIDEAVQAALDSGYFDLPTLYGDPGDFEQGGEGMRAFYDKMLVSETNKFVKKWGAKVQGFGKAVETEQEPFEEDSYSLDVMDEGRLYGGEPIHALTLTPKMIVAARRGFPLFSLADNSLAAQEHAQKLYSRTDWNRIDPDTDAAIAGGMTADEIQDAIAEWALHETGSKYFKRWFGNSQITDSFGAPIVMFHGSLSNDISRFDVSQTYRDFISLTTSPDFASQFAGKEYDVAEGRETYVPGATVYPVYVRANKVFDFRNAKMRRSFRRWLKSERGVTDSVAKALSGRIEDGDWGGMESKDIQMFLSVRGYDAFWMVENGALNLGVFDPRNIKSVHNTGIFNQRTRDTLLSLSEGAQNEISRRIDLYQLMAHLERTTNPDSKPAAIRAHLQDGLERGLYSLNAVNQAGLTGDVASRAKALADIWRALRGPEIKTSEPMTAEVVQQEINKFTQTWVRKPPVSIVKTTEELPDYLGIPPGETGVEGTIDPYDNNRIYIVASNIYSVPHLHKVFTEESLGHYGLRAFFGDAALDAFLAEILPSVKGSPAWDALLARYRHLQVQKGDDAQTAINKELTAAEELIAKMDVDQSVWQKFVAWLRNQLRSKGLITNWTENDVRRVMASVHRNMVRGTLPRGKRNHAPSMRATANPYSLSIFPFPQYAEEYPPVTWEMHTNEKGKTYPRRKKTPETKAFTAERGRIQKDMEKNGFEPYFDPDKRGDVDSDNYPIAPERTIDIQRKVQPKKIEEWKEKIQTYEARKRLQNAFITGLAVGYSDQWYAMEQMEAEYIGEYGIKKGRQMFREKFAEAMAYTTAGQDPTANLMFAAYVNYKAQRGEELPENLGYMPVPLQGAYVGNEAARINRIWRGEVEVNPETMPKRFNFLANFLGYKDMSTIDRQMTQIITPEYEAPPVKTYAYYEELIAEMAEKNGVSPREFQDVAWGGHKYITSKGRYAARPMIQHINEAIERTHRLTGVSREDVVRRGLIRSQIPVYSLSDNEPAPHSGPNPEGYRTDNPGGQWLEAKRAAVVKEGRDNRFPGKPYKRSGTVTAYLIKQIELPIQMLAAVRGLRGEQRNVRRDDLRWLLEYMGREQRLPPNHNGDEYAPFIMVDQDGVPWVNEGNHRIMAAAKLGWSSLPVEIRWYNGGEETAKEWHPKNLAKVAVKVPNRNTLLSLRPNNNHPEESRIINEKIARSHSQMTVLDRVSNWLIDLKRAMAAGDFIWGLKQGVLDDAASVERYERALFGTILDASVSPYKAMHTVKNLPSVMAAIAHAGIPVYRDGAFQPEGTRKGFIEILRPLYEHPDGDLLDLWEGYAAARRSAELIQQQNEDGTSREKLFTQDEIDQLLALGDTYPVFKDVFDEWQQFNKDLLDLAVERGVLSETQRDIWSQNDYVPFYRATEEIEGIDQRTGFGAIRAGVSGQKPNIHQLHGSEKKLGNIVENIWFNTASLIDKIYKNEAMTRVVDMLEGTVMREMAMPWEDMQITDATVAAALAQAGLVEEGDNGEVVVRNMTADQRNAWNAIFRSYRPIQNNVVSVMRNGRLKHYEVRDEALLRTLQGMHAEGLAGMMKAMGMSKAVLTRMITIDPAFMLANWMRDTLSAWVTSDSNFIPVADSVRSMGDVFREEGSFIQMMMSGAGGGGFFDLSGGNVRRVLDEELSHGGKHWAHTLWKGYLKIGAASENSNRLAIMRKIIANGGTVAEGAYQAQDIMNFTMSGDFAAIKFLIRTVPFLNARMQGLYRLYRGGRDHPVGFMIKGVALMTASLALLARNWEDDDYERLEDWQKDTNWNFFVDGIHYAIPKPFEVGILFGTAPERLSRLLLDRDDLEVSKESLKRALGETLAFNPIPQLFKPMYELGANKNLFTGAPIVNQSMSGLEYPEQFMPWTSPAAVEVGQLMPEWTGPAQSPLRIQHTVRAYLGTVGLYTMNAADAIIRGLDGSRPEMPTTKWYERPVLSRVIKGEAATNRHNKYAEKMYRIIDQSDKAQRSFNKMVAEGRIEQAREFAVERRHLIDTSGKARPGSPRKAILQFENALREISVTSRAIMLSRDMTPEEKRERLDAFNVRRHEILERAAELMARLDEIEAGQ